MSFFGPIIIILIVHLAIYLASSWRNTYYPDVLAALRAAGHDVYDFRNPGDGTDGFKWSKIDPDYMDWTPEVYREQLYNHPLAEQQFQNDLRAISATVACCYFHVVAPHIQRLATSPDRVSLSMCSFLRSRSQT